MLKFRVNWTISSSSREATVCGTLFRISEGRILPRWLTPTDLGKMANFLANLTIGWTLGQTAGWAAAPHPWHVDVEGWDLRFCKCSNWFCGMQLSTLLLCSFLCSTLVHSCGKCKVSKRFSTISGSTRPLIIWSQMFECRRQQKLHVFTSSRRDTRKSVNVSSTCLWKFLCSTVSWRWPSMYLLMVLIIEAKLTLSSSVKPRFWTTDKVSREKQRVSACTCLAASLSASPDKLR